MGGCQTHLKEEIKRRAHRAHRRANEAAGGCLFLPTSPLLPGLGGLHQISLRTVMPQPSPHPGSGPS